MTMKLRFISPTLAMLIALLLPLAANGQATGELKTCLQKVADENLAGKVRFQNDLAALVVEKYPDFTELATLNRDLQVALAEARTIRLAYFIGTDVERFVKASSLTRFTNFDWIETDENILAERNPDYAALMERVEALTLENEAHPDWPALRARFGELQSGEDFQQILKNLMDAQSKAEDRLKGC